MKSYLDLIPASAKVHKKQNKMTFLCIVFAVFLVTAVFSTAEMGLRMESARLTEKHGSINYLSIFQSSMAKNLFLAAGALFVLVLIAGSLMISGSINSNVAERSSFFGMMRCIGMSKKQVKRYVILEALNRCKKAVPVGLILGTVATWILCAILHFAVGEEFSNIPIFGISLAGLISGSVIGVLTVLIASLSPAKKAAKVSPVAAVSGKTGNKKNSKKMSNKGIFKIETRLGINHAVSAGKNMFLMTASFALSIILFLCFAVFIDFVGFLMPQSSSAADISIAAKSENKEISMKLAEELGNIKGVREVYGRNSALNIPAKINGEKSEIDIISFDDFEIRNLKKDGVLKRKSNIKKIFENSSYCIGTWDKESNIKTGDKISVNNHELEISALTKYDPFSSDGMTKGRLTIITSKNEFEALTGKKGYSILMLKTDKEFSDKEVSAIRKKLGKAYVFKDERNNKTAGTYMAFTLCIYAFLTVITMVSVLNIINSISMSVSARMKQYGAMRAVGMDEDQLTKMIAAESFTYAVSGCIAGTLLGLLLSSKLYTVLITNHFPNAVWTVPFKSLIIILAVILISAAIATAIPAKRIRKISVTETIKDL